MLVNGMIYANDTILETVLEELKDAMTGRTGTFTPSLTQVAQVACLPGISILYYLVPFLFIPLLS